ncbi:hypothetical protein D9758_013865 [Tetrapyrgos nigripes]|uniref:Uncharacterized protein n=1 Tax=Tetrapyrgos nigripes TaxID=182062 RepID=A0A8H5CSU2_9AGAR|nr:hypothetical protein D9758_013865 [Tetrapyrgos nigripes]
MPSSVSYRQSQFQCSPSSSSHSQLQPQPQPQPQPQLARHYQPYVLPPMADAFPSGSGSGSGSGYGHHAYQNQFRANSSLPLHYPPHPYPYPHSIPDLHSNSFHGQGYAASIPSGSYSYQGGSSTTSHLTHEGALASYAAGLDNAGIRPYFMSTGSGTGTGNGDGHRNGSGNDEADVDVNAKLTEEEQRALDTYFFFP